MFLRQITHWLFPDKRTQREKDQEREFIEAINSLKTLSVNKRGMSIDPEEIRDIVIASRENLKHLVSKQHKVTPAPAASPLENFHADLHESLDAIQHVSWRRLADGSSVQYVCLQSLTTGLYSVACASLFSGDSDSLPPWLGANISNQVATALKTPKLHWYETIKEARDAWDREL
jgi:hypothetical protein